MAKYEYAIYFNNSNVIQKIYPTELHDIAILTFARDTELYDATEQVRIYPRYRKDAPHFFSLQEATRSVLNREENSKEHEKRVNENFKGLYNNSQKNFKFGHYVWEDGNQQFYTMTNLKDYIWGKEVTRIISENIICRHDIYGRKKGLSQSSINPEIAIEVIDTHYPEAKVFDEWLMLSKIQPIIIVFDMIKMKNYYFKIEKDVIRFVYYIYDGNIWCGGERKIDITSGRECCELLKQAKSN